jgi:hypothetical protein
VKTQLWPLLIVATLGAALALALPRTAAAQGGSETITAQVTLTMPSGERVAGTLVNRRTLDAAVHSTWTFNGMLNGQPVRAGGEAAERWLGDGKLEIAMTKITEFTVNNGPVATNPDGSPYIPQSLLQTVVIETSGDGVVSVRGIPIAIGGKLLPPGSGDQSYVVSNAGAGAGRVTAIPNTADRAPAAAPLYTPALAGAALAVLAGAALRRIAPR